MPKNYMPYSPGGVGFPRIPEYTPSTRESSAFDLKKQVGKARGIISDR